MKPRIPIRIGLPLLLVATCLATSPAAEPVLDPDDISWVTEGTEVVFTLHFRNPDPTEPTVPMTGQLSPMEYGAFAPPSGVSADFDIPPIPPDSFFDVVVPVPVESLPPSAAEQHPWDLKAAGGQKDGPCPDDDHWDGNVDVIWAPGGVGQAYGHYGNLLVCPGFGNSYIHVVTGCAVNASWNFTGGCAGFSISLVDEDLVTPAPAMLPPGWSGHICVSAVSGTGIGVTCNFALNVTCGASTVPVNLSVLTCDCGPIHNEAQSWGGIKDLYK